MDVDTSDLLEPDDEPQYSTSLSSRAPATSFAIVSDQHSPATSDLCEVDCNTDSCNDMDEWTDNCFIDDATQLDVSSIVQW